MKNNKKIQDNTNPNPNEWLIVISKFVDNVMRTIPGARLTNFLPINNHQARARISSGSSINNNELRVIYYDYKEQKEIERADIDRNCLWFVERIERIERKGGCVEFYRRDGDDVLVTYTIRSSTIDPNQCVEVREERKTERFSAPKKQSNDGVTVSRHGRK